MRRSVFFLVLLAAILVICVAAFVLGRLIVPPGEAELRARAAWTPPASQQTPLVRATGTLARTTPQPTITPTRAVGITRAVATVVPPTRADSSSSSETPTSSPTPTQSPTATAGTFAFVLARPLRHSAGDCPGIYVLGQVSDRRGNPLPNVSVRLTDEYGNQQGTTTKSGANEIGRYDFPIFGPARRLYLGIVDARNQPLSAVVEIPHGLGAFAKATCHWADWQQQ